MQRSETSGGCPGRSGATTPTPSFLRHIYVIPAHAGIHAPFVPDERGANAVSGVCPGRRGAGPQIATNPSPFAPSERRRVQAKQARKGMPGSDGRRTPPSLHTPSFLRKQESKPPSRQRKGTRASEASTQGYARGGAGPLHAHTRPKYT